MTLLVTLGFGAVGWVDDWRKVVHRDPEGAGEPLEIRQDLGDRARRGDLSSGSPQTPGGLKPN